jgi:hypothetical protein
MFALEHAGSHGHMPPSVQGAQAAQGDSWALTLFVGAMKGGTSAVASCAAVLCFTGKRCAAGAAWARAAGAAGACGGAASMSRMSTMAHVSEHPVPAELNEAVKLAQMSMGPYLMAQAFPSHVRRKL